MKRSQKQPRRLRDREGHVPKHERKLASAPAPAVPDTAMASALQRAMAKAQGPQPGSQGES